MKFLPVLQILQFLTEFLWLAAADPRCSKVVLHGWCLSEATFKWTRTLSACNFDFYVSANEFRCRLNEQGDYCGSFPDHFDDLRAASEECLDSGSRDEGQCSESCQDKLALLEEELGCCILEMLKNPWIPHTAVFSPHLWEDCNMTFPTKPCLPSPLHRALTDKKKNCSEDELYQTALQEVCNRRSVQPLLEWYESHDCTMIGEDHINSCALDEQGEWCIRRLNDNFRALGSAVQSSSIHCLGADECSSHCRMALLTIRDILGCCLTNTMNNSFVELVYAESYENYRKHLDYKLWEMCGIPRLDHCTNIKLFGISSSSSDHQTPSYYTVIMLALLLNLRHIL